MVQSSCNIKAKIKTFDVVVLLIIFALLPALLSNTLTFFDSNFNYVRILSFYYLISLVLITLLNLIFKKPYLALFYGCHSKKDRSFSFIHKHFSLCTRCTGIYLGMLSVFFISLFSFNYTYLIILVIPLIIDGVLQYKTSYVSNNTKRLITGILFGLGFVVLLSNFFYYQSKLIIYLASLLKG